MKTKKVTKAGKPLGGLVLFEPQRILAELLSRHLAQIHRFTVLGLAKDVEETAKLIERFRPAVLLIDAIPQQAELSETVVFFKQAWPTLHQVVFNGPHDHDTIRATLVRGVDSYLAPDANLSELLNAVDAALVGDHYFGDSIIHLIKEDYIKNAFQVCRLTPREIAVKEGFEVGLSMKEVAERLSVDIRTIERYQRSIAWKAGGRIEKKSKNCADGT